MFKTACVQGMEQLKGQAIKNNRFKIMNQGYPSGLTSCFFNLPIMHFGEAVCITQPMDKKTFPDLLLDKASISQHTLRQHTL